MFETHLMQDLIDKAHLEKPPSVAPLSFYEYKGYKYNIRELAKMSGISPGTMRNRLGAGWSIEKAMSTPIAPRRRRKRQHV